MFTVREKKKESETEPSVDNEFDEYDRSCAIDRVAYLNCLVKLDDIDDDSPCENEKANLQNCIKLALDKLNANEFTEHHHNRKKK